MEKYRRVKVLGKGSFGKAFLVENTATEADAPPGTADSPPAATSLCVVKQMETGMMTPKQRSEALKEASVLRRMIGHPNIVAFHEVFITKKGRLCIVMDYCNDGDLHQKLKAQKTRMATALAGEASSSSSCGRSRSGGSGGGTTSSSSSSTSNPSSSKKSRDLLLPEKVITDWLAQICFALQHVHSRKVLHRDLKTQNVFLHSPLRGENEEFAEDVDQNVLFGQQILKLGDFGISRVLDATKDYAKTMVGTPYYLSPEIIEDLPYSYQSDVWSLGVMLYEMCTLKHPFDAESLHFLAVKILNGKYPPIDSELYSPELDSLIRRMLSKNPGERPTVWQIIQSPLLRESIFDVNERFHFGWDLSTLRLPEEKEEVEEESTSFDEDVTEREQRTAPASSIEVEEPQERTNHDNEVEEVILDDVVTGVPVAALGKNSASPTRHDKKSADQADESPAPCSSGGSGGSGELKKTTRGGLGVMEELLSDREKTGTRRFLRQCAKPRAQLQVDASESDRAQQVDASESDRRRNKSQEFEDDLPPLVVETRSSVPREQNTKQRNYTTARTSSSVEEYDDGNGLVPSDMVHSHAPTTISASLLERHRDRHAHVSRVASANGSLLAASSSSTSSSSASMSALTERTKEGDNITLQPADSGTADRSCSSSSSQMNLTHSPFESEQQNIGLGNHLDTIAEDASRVEEECEEDYDEEDYEEDFEDEDCYDDDEDFEDDVDEEEESTSSTTRSGAGRSSGSPNEIQKSVEPSSNSSRKSGSGRRDQMFRQIDINSCSVDGKDSGNGPFAAGRLVVDVPTEGAPTSTTRTATSQIKHAERPFSSPLISSRRSKTSATGASDPAASSSSSSSTKKQEYQAKAESLRAYLAGQLGTSLFQRAYGLLTEKEDSSASAQELLVDEGHQQLLPLLQLLCLLEDIGTGGRSRGREMV
ncbi:unnamed protein product [Amoebophrya sp. A25]|nr:unnamed protein product [Amoebophrya sp. A25]|eukprot:GSA25T00014690001.1